MSRRNLTDREKDEIRRRFGNACPGLPHLGIKCGKPLETNSAAVFDHVDQRVFTGSDAADQFQPLCTGRGGCNDIKTNGLGGLKRISSVGSDAHVRAKFRRANGLNAERPKRKIPNRPFPKQHRPLKSRSTWR